MKNTYSKITKILSVISVVIVAAAALFAVIFAAALMVWVAYSVDYQWSVPIWAEWVILVFQRGGYMETIYSLSYHIVYFSLSSMIAYYMYAYLKAESSRGIPFTYDGVKEICGLGIKMIVLTVLSSAVIFVAGYFVNKSFFIGIVGDCLSFIIVGILFVIYSFILKILALKHTSDLQTNDFNE